MQDVETWLGLGQGLERGYKTTLNLYVCGHRVSMPRVTLGTSDGGSPVTVPTDCTHWLLLSWPQCPLHP